MKSTWLPALLVLLAAGCTPPANGPSSNTSSSDLSISAPSEQSPSGVPAVNTTLVSLNIPGMTCEGCAMEVKDTLSPLPGVVDVKADPVKQTATVRVNAAKFDSKVALEKLAAAHFEDSTVVQ